ncbi:MAG TPA: ABC transporter permease [Blastocatellia bacterium]|nr:ABC transporter permease [Blastocatellia bacterium]
MFSEWTHRTWLRLKALVQRRRLEHDLEDEIAFHLAMREENYRDAGMTAGEAHNAVRRRVGNVVLWKEISHDMWTFVSLENLLQDLRYGARVLLKNPGFTVVAVITLALGIGANAAIFSVVNGVLLNTVPFKDSGQLVSITEMEPELADAPVSAPDFCDWKTQNSAFATMSAVITTGFNLTGSGPPERLIAAGVSTDFFPMLGVQPVMGRDFSPEEDDPNHQQTALISYALWQSHFGGDRATVGKSMTLGGRSFTIIGVMPAGLKLDYPQPQVWIPVSCQTRTMIGNRGTHFMGVWGRLKPNVTIKQAQAEMDTIAKRLEQQYPASNSGLGVHVMSLAQAETTDVRPRLLLLLGAVGFVLLIVCANVANLQLVRASARQREIAVRAAIGASRARLIHQLLTEGLLLALTGGALGLGLAYISVPLLARSLPKNVTEMWDIRVNGEVMLFTFGLAVITAVLFGIIPAFRSSRPNLNDALGSSQRQTAGAAHQRLRALLVIGEVAVALLLLVSAGLMFRSSLLLRADYPGFDTRNVLTMRVDLQSYKYKEDDQQAAFFKQAIEKISALPGVESAGGTTSLPGENGGSSGLQIVGEPAPADNQKPLAGTYVVTPGYFRAAGIKLLEGRLFTEADDAKSAPVTIIDQRLVDKYFKDQNPIGRHVNVDKDREIIGVVGTVKEQGFNENMPELYFPNSQLPNSSLELVIKTGVEPLSLTNSVTGAIQSVDHDQPVRRVSSLQAVYEEGQLGSKLSTTLFVAFGLLALTLAAVGIYGVMAYSASQRTHEIGIRMAMGARPGDVMGLMLRQGAFLGLIGAGIGIGASLLLTRFLSGLLFGVKPTDPLTFGAAALVLILVALAACYLPARRATGVDPIKALRWE